MTKFYLHSASSAVSGTLPSDEQSSLTPDSNDFEGSRTTNRKMDTTIGVSQANLTNQSTADTNAHNYYVSRWVSPLIYETIIQAKTWTLEFGAKEANTNANFPASSTSVALRVNVYVWKPSNGTKVGTILDGSTNADGEEAGTTQSVVNCTFSGSAVTGLTPGDAVIVYEMWAVVTQAMGTQYQQDVYYDGTTEGSTSNIAAFLSTPQDIVFTKTALSASEIVSGASQASTANTTEYWPLVGKSSPFTTEADTQIIFKKSGTVSKLGVRITTNGITGNTVFTVRKNAADTTLTVTFGSSATGLQEDLSHSFTVAAGDKIALKSVPGGATGTFAMSNVTLLFTPDDDIPTHIMGSSGPPENLSTASVTRYIPIGGRAFFTSTENNAKARQRKPGTFKNVYLYVTANARTNSTTFKSRKNGADGNISITIGAGVTGVFEDTSNSDVVAAGDDYCYSITTGTGTETLSYSIVEINFFPDAYAGQVTSCYTGTSTIANAQTKWGIVGGQPTGFGAEADAKRTWRVTKALFSNLQVYVKTNSLTADSTVTFMINGVAGNEVVTLTQGATGLFSDNTHTDFVQSGDEIDYKIVTGATGTSIDINLYNQFYETGVMKPFIYKFNVLKRISKSFIYKFNVLQRISKAFIYKFNVLKRISKAFIYKFNVVKRISKSFIYKFNVVKRISKAFIYKFNVVKRISKSFIYKFNVTTRISKSFIYKFNVLKRISKSFIYKFNVVQRVSKQFRYLFNVQKRISKAFIYKFNVTVRVTKSFIYKFNVLQRVSKSFIYKFNVVKRVSKAFIYKFNVLQRITKSFIYKFNVQQRISKQFRYLFNVQKRVSKAFIYKFNVLKRISKSFIYKFNILARVSKPFTYLFDIISAGIRVSKSFTYKFNIVQRTSKSFTYKFNVLKRISKSFIYKFNVTVRVTKQFIYKFNVVQRVSKSFIYKFNILKRISKSFVYKFNVVQRISKQFRYRFNVTVRVTKQFIYKFNITVRITKSFTYKFNILKRVSKSFIYKFNVVQRISKIFRYRFNILQRISKAFRFPFNITVRITKSFTYLFNITSRVSLAFTYPFNVVQRISKEFTYPFKITAPIQLIATFFDTVSINFQQGVGEIFVSGRASVEVLRKFFT